jgi:membrane protease YdiL (CAAX protease family)
MSGSSKEPTNRVSKAQFLRLSKWFTLTLCLIATVLPLPFGRPGVWTNLALSGVLTWQTAISGMLGLFFGGFVALLVAHWRPFHVIGERVTGLVAWESFLLSDYVMTSVLASLGEELLFRGALQPLIGLVPMAIVFGLLHATSIAHVVLAGCLGFWLGWLFTWTGSLWPPIFAHLTLDLVTGVLLTRTLESMAEPIQGD